MFFQSIYQMLAAGTDLCINIRKINGNLSVIVMPRRTNLKDEAGQLIVPLVLDGTPVELDEQFLQAVTTPLQKVQGILVNLESFEKQAQQATTQSKAVKTVNDKESKEIREKREKMEKLLKKSDEAVMVGKYSEATMWLKQARALATPDKQKDIDVQMQEVQKKATEGSLFAEATPQTQSVPQQPSINGISKGQQAEGQMQMFPADPEGKPLPNSNSQCISKQLNLCHSHKYYNNSQSSKCPPNNSQYINLCHSHRYNSNNQYISRLHKHTNLKPYNLNQYTDNIINNRQMVFPITQWDSSQSDNHRCISNSLEDNPSKCNNGSRRNPCHSNRRHPLYKSHQEIQEENTNRNLNLPKHSASTKMTKVIGRFYVKTRM